MCEGRSCECENSECAPGSEYLCSPGGVCIGASVLGSRGFSVRAGLHTGCPLLRRGGRGAGAGPWTRQGAPRDSRQGPRGFQPRGRPSWSGAARGGVWWGSPRGRDRTHRGRRRGCPRARGRRAAWRLRVAGKVPGSGGRPAPQRAGPPWCALRPGRHRLTSGLRRPQTPRPPFPARYGLAAQLRPLPLARRTWPSPGPSPRPAPAQPRLRVASARPAGRLRLRDSSLPRKATPLGAAAAAPPPSHSLPPAQRRRRRRDLPLDLSSKFCPGWDF